MGGATRPVRKATCQPLRRRRPCGSRPSTGCASLTHSYAHLGTVRRRWEKFPSLTEEFAEESDGAFEEMLVLSAFFGHDGHGGRRSDCMVTVGMEIATIFQQL